MKTKVIHALIFSKTLYSVEKAMDWAEANGFPTPIGVPQPSHNGVVVLNLVDHSQIEKSGHEVISLAPGISGVGAKLTTEVQKSFASNFGEISSDGKSAAEKLNKESFNGQTYVRAAPGTRKEVTAPNGTDSIEKVEKRFEIMKADASKRIVIGAVYVPYDENDPSTVDTHGHAASAEDIEKAAYGFMLDMKNNQIDKQHNHRPDYGNVVESYIAKAQDPLFKEGTWVLGVKVTCEKTWAAIQAGDITGFSLGGSAVLEELQAS